MLLCQPLRIGSFPIQLSFLLCRYGIPGCKLDRLRRLRLIWHPNTQVHRLLSNYIQVFLRICVQVHLSDRSLSPDLHRTTPLQMLLKFLRVLLLDWRPTTRVIPHGTIITNLPHYQVVFSFFFWVTPVQILRARNHTHKRLGRWHFSHQQPLWLRCKERFHLHTFSRLTQP